MLRLLSLTLVVVSCAASPPKAGNTTNSRESSVTQDAELNIIDGEPVLDINDAVAASTVGISFSVNGQGALCSGTIIGPNQVVTAGHCIGANSELRFLYDFRPANVRVTAAVRHPRYGNIGDPDIGVLTFEGPLPPPLRPAAIASREVGPGTKLLIAGYGKDAANNVGKLNKKVVDYLGPDPNFRPTIVQTSLGTCNGDSGGPAYVNIGGNNLTLIGITSFGPIGCRGSGYSEDIRIYQGWLRCTFEALGKPLPSLEADDSGYDCNPPRLPPAPLYYASTAFGDCIGSDITVFSAVNADCAKACMDNAGCLGFAYSYEAHRCVLKTINNCPVRANNGHQFYTSIVRPAMRSPPQGFSADLPGDCVGYDINSKPDTDVNACAAMCNATPACLGFSHNFAGRLCFLKSTASCPNRGFDNFQFYSKPPNYYTVQAAGDCEGSDLSILKDKSRDECADSCTDALPCLGFSYNAANKLCIHKSIASCPNRALTAFQFYTRTPYFRAEVFNPQFYRSRYADLGQLSEHALRIHWNDVGINQGRQAAAGFDLRFYRQTYGDLAKLSNAALIDHWLSYGIKEGRLGKSDSASATFNTQDSNEYLKRTREGNR